MAESHGGLSTGEALRRLAHYGPNDPAPRDRRSGARQLAAQFESPVTLLLLAAATLSLVLGAFGDGAIILGITLLSGLLGFRQERRATSAVQELLALLRSTANVERDGVWRSVPIEEVVPGDLVRLSAGASVPGDARLLDARDLFVDESALTGESFPIEKAPAGTEPDRSAGSQAAAVFLGTHVVSGMATARIERTGGSTKLGSLGRRLVLRPPATEFEHGVRRFGYMLLEIALVLVVVVFAINVWLERPVLDALLFTLALAVGLTPQLLPAIVSVTLSHGARRMARERVIVRRLVAIEDLGGMDILCTDKTGTLTEGTVTLHEAADWTGAWHPRIRLLAYLNAAFESGFPNPIDRALRTDPPADADRWHKVDEVPYDFARRRLTVAVTDGMERLAITKGAVADVLAVCERAEDAAGARTPIADVREAIHDRVRILGAAGYRCLGLAVRSLVDDAPIDRVAEHGLTFLGILSFTDPLKATASASLRELAALGIQVKLVTGDSREVAARVAADAGLDTAVVLTGADLRHLSEPALVSAAPVVGVFAEVEPIQKERIIRALRKGGHAVGFLGDGINDAPALHAADVGISVDSAADVTRQAADIVLLDKDLRVLCRGVWQGRRAFANTLKYVFITMSASFGNMFSMAGASLFTAFLPLLPKQILLINVLTDLPAMAIAGDRVDAELAERPRRWDTGAIRRFMLSFGLVSSLFDYLTFGVLLALAVPAATFRTAWLVESVLSELCILLVIRTRRPAFRSRPGTALIVTSALVAAATLALPYTPLARPLELGPLSLPVLALVLGIVAFYAAVSEVSKRHVFRRATL